MTTKQQIFGTGRLAFRVNAFNVEIWQIISGRWVFPVPVVPVLKSITIADPPTVLTVVLSLMKIVTLKFGILSSCKMNEVLAAVKMDIQSLANYQQKVLILV